MELVAGHWVGGVVSFPCESARVRGWAVDAGHGIVHREGRRGYCSWKSGSAD